MKTNCSTSPQSAATNDGPRRTVTEEITIEHTSFLDAAKRLEQCFAYADTKSEAEGLAIVGESGTGKTTVLRGLLTKHQKFRSADGMVVPILSATVPSAPTVKSFAGVLLEALGDPAADRGTENERTKRLRVLMRGTGTRMVMIDEAQHFVDRKNDRVIHHVADWLKILIDDTKTTLVIAGLPSCLGVLAQNEQLARRFLAPVELPRFDWNQAAHRRDFLSILLRYGKSLSNAYSIPEIHSSEFGFAIWKATGGLMGYLAKLLRQLERNASLTGSTSLTILDFDRAYREAICTLRPELRSLNPFEVAAPATEDCLAMATAVQLGVPTTDRPSKRGRRTAARTPLLNAVFAR